MLNRSRLNKSLIVLAGILILIIVTVNYVRPLNNIQNSNLTPTPTVMIPSNSNRNYTDEELVELKTDKKKRFKPLNRLQIAALNRFKTKFDTEPIKRFPEFEIGYSELLRKYYVYKKTSRSDIDLFVYFNDLELVKLYQEIPQRYFIDVDKQVDVAIAEVEDLYMKEMEVKYSDQIK